jgi:ABC-2 type transport system ATP-binding protein
MQISADMVKQLREKTGAGIMDAKRALEVAGAQVSASSDGLTVTGLDAEVIGRVALEQGIVLRELRPITAELEDIFMELTAGGGIA